MNIVIKLIFFKKKKGSRYWRYTHFQLDADYPKDLSEGFAGVPSNIDTALVWSGNGKIYFFKGMRQQFFVIRKKGEAGEFFFLC
jgi:matrix metalloproteinase-14 (membrane-inserted)